MMRRTNFIFTHTDAFERLRLAAAAIVRADLYGRVAMTYASCEDLVREVA